MSRIQVDNIFDKEGTGAPTFPAGLTGTTGAFTGNVSIGGTLTYEDVTNIDSVGIITARSDISIADKIIHTGDTNTSIRFPAVDTFTVETAGSEALRITSDGKIGIGTDLTGDGTDSALSVEGVTAITNLDQTLMVRDKNTDDAIGRGGNIGFGAYVSDTVRTLAAIGGAKEVSGNNFSGNLVFYTRRTGEADLDERLRIDSSGRVGIGVLSPGKVLDLQATSNLAIRYYNGSTFRAGLEVATNSGDMIGASTANDFCVRSQKNILFSTNGNTERMRLDTSGRLLVGTTSRSSTTSAVFQANSANASGAGVIQIARGQTFTGTDTNVGNIEFTDSGGNIFGRINCTSDGTTAAGSDHPGRLVFSTTADGASSPTERMRIQSDGGVVVGPSGGSAGVLFTVSETGASNPAIIELKGTNSNGDLSSNSRIASQQDGALTSSALTFTTRNSGSYVERMRILSAGEVRTYSTTSNTSFRNSNAAATTNAFITGLYGASGVSSGGTVSLRIWTNGNIQNTNNSYGSLSDIKLKENIVDANSQWADIKDLRVRNYNFIEGQTHTQLGLVAQEVETVSPGLVSESPDQDGEGNDLGTTTKSVNYSVLYMKAVKALQESMTRIETLEKRLSDAGIA